MNAAVREVVLRPMLALYPPPTHLRGDQETINLALVCYEQALGRFDRATLEAGWHKTLAEQTFWVWPSPGTIAEACRRCQHRAQLPDEQKQARQRAEEMTGAYVSRFLKTSQVAKLARREGWAGQLREYLHDRAWVHAAVLCGLQEFGWNATIAADLGQFSSSAQAFAAYRKHIDRQVQSGQIRVRVPAARIEEWRHLVARAEQKEGPIR